MNIKLQGLPTKVVILSSQMAFKLKYNSLHLHSLNYKLVQAQLSRFSSTHVVKIISKKIHLNKLQEDAKETVGKQTPLCVILGWGNSTQKQLKKYSDIYEKKGFNTMTVSPLLIDALVLPETRGKKISYQVMEAISNEFNADRVPVVFHQFSNGGCALYYFICEEICSRESKYASSINVSGSIFDSCPVIPSFESIVIAQRAFTNEVESPFVKAAVWYLLRLMLPFVIWLNPVVKIFMDGLEKSPISTPQLFLYSKADMLAPYKDISLFIQKRQETGVEVMSKLWEDSPHVRHLMHDQDGYIESVQKFIDKLSLR